MEPLARKDSKGREVDELMMAEMVDLNVDEVLDEQNI
jgi:hypothetical protein